MTTIINRNPRTRAQEIARLTELIEYNSDRLMQGWWEKPEKAASIRAWIADMKRQRALLEQDEQDAEAEQMFLRPINPDPITTMLRKKR